MRAPVSVLLVVLAACGSAARTGEPPPEPRPLPADVLHRPAIAYSGYRAGQSPDQGLYPSEDEIGADLALLVRGGWGFIRLFDCSVHAERVLSVIASRHLDLRVMLGVWIAGAKAGHDAANQAEIARCTALVRAHPDLIVAVSVGNETLDDWSDVRVAPAELAAYIDQVRGQIAVPVTTDDSWLPFALGQDGATSYADVVQVAAASDFLSLHVYAFSDAYYDGWDWKQDKVPAEQRAAAMMAGALQYSKTSVRQVRDAMAAHGVDRPIIVGEIGWKSATRYTRDDAPEQRIEVFLAHPVNQAMFYDAVTGWVYGSGRDGDSPDAAFTFEAFDEPWKGEWGDDGWGLFDTDRHAKYVLRDRFPDLVPAGAPVYGPGDAVYYMP
jgi:exo-beta-1,3-glucanase (GH17 family)